MDTVKCDKPGCDGEIHPDTLDSMTASCSVCGGSSGILESDEEEDTAKRRMLEGLETFRRKVETGEIVGIVMVAQCDDGYVLDRSIGEPPSPAGILILQDIASVAADIFRAKHHTEDDGKPRLRATEKEEE